MSYFAEIENGKVKQVLVIDDSWSEQQAISWLKDNVSNNDWVQTFKDGKRGRYAGIGYEFHPQDDFFVPPKPYQSWQLDKQAKAYKAPKPMPKDDKIYSWDEKTNNWKENTSRILEEGI